MYGMEVVHPSPVEFNAFRRQTRPIYEKWAKEIGMDLVTSAERIVDHGK
jgi:TRAP-type C4-dicarboxylate transport system substrate-binding protein